jgi:hypothetical protein
VAQLAQFVTNSATTPAAADCKRGLDDAERGFVAVDQRRAITMASAFSVKCAQRHRGRSTAHGVAGR